MDKIRLYELAEQLKDESGRTITECVDTLIKFNYNFNKSLEHFTSNGR